MRSNEFMLALNALCAERDLSKDIVFDAIESALQAAYRRDFEHDPNITVVMDRSTGQARVYVEWKVVESVEDPRTEILLQKARRKYGANTQLGDTVREERTPRNFGRIAAQTAKQVILQRIREAERDRLYHDYANRKGEIIIGTVQSVDHKTRAVRLAVGKVEASLPRPEQLPGERYRVGQRVRVFVAEVQKEHRGPQITVSRTHRQLLRRLLELEVPEIANGTVDLRSIAREPGARSKVAVAALQPGIDAVGACVGMKGIRIQSIVNELNGEKIDIVQWNPDDETYVANALSPAKVINVYLDEYNPEGKTAIVVVPDKQLSLAIGKEGQNARLAAKLTGWRIDIKSASEAAEEQIHLTGLQPVARAPKVKGKNEEEDRLAAARALLAEAESLFDDESDDDFSLFGEVDELAFGSDEEEEEDGGLSLFDEDDLELDLFDDTPEEEPDDEEDALLLADEEDSLLLADDEEDALLLADDEEDSLELEGLAEEEDDLLLADDSVAEEAFVLADDEEDLFLLEEEEEEPAPPPPPVVKQVAPKPKPPKPKPSKPKPPKPKAKPKPPPPPPPPPPVIDVEPWDDFEEEEEEEEESPKSTKPKAPMIFYTLNDRGEAESLDDTVERKKRQRRKKKKKRRQKSRRKTRY